MNMRIPAIIAVLFLLAGCGNAPTQPDASGESPAVKSPETPEGVVKTIFEVAKTQDFSQLQSLCDPQGENDDDTQRICDLATDEESQASFVQYFEKGEVSDAVQISEDGTQASVPFVFGPDGDQTETMELINRDGNWYLSSF
ncbi:MAG: hypothetical protein AAGD25_22540 [Cyanobacteria bacterium P01_F01_bin.150]